MRRRIGRPALQRQRLFQTEFQLRLSWYVDGLAACQYLSSCSGCPARQSTDGRSFAATCKRPNDRSGNRTAAYEFAGPFVLADPAVLPARGGDVGCFDRITAAPYRN